MVSLTFLTEIGFTKEMIEQYVYYANIFDDRIIPICNAYFDDKITFKEALDRAKQLAVEGISPYTTELIFIIESTKYLENKYLQRGVARSVFVDSMRDIACKVRECLSVKGVFGTFVAWWYDRFFDMTRMAFGRLQYDIDVYPGDTIEVGSYVMNKGELILTCHIPSAGPLEHELCVESYKKAYEFFRDKLKDGILPISLHFLRPVTISLKSRSTSQQSEPSTSSIPFQKR